MALLFNNNFIFVYFFAIIAIFNYSTLKEYQRIAIIYITVFALAFLKITSVFMALALAIIALFCFTEILTNDDEKFLLLSNPIYKFIDFIYISIFQYYFWLIAIAICMNGYVWQRLISNYYWILKMLSIILMVEEINLTLEQKFVVASFKDMYKYFSNFPINKVHSQDIPEEYYQILTSIEDRAYFERKSYTYLSLDALKSVIQKKVGKSAKISDKARVTSKAIWMFIHNTVNKERGYSTIQMQLLRSIGIKRGYNCVLRRKVFEFIYTPMFFKGLLHYYKLENVSGRKYLKKYILYIYYHNVNTFFGDIWFSKFMNAFDFTGKKKLDIQDLTLEGVFIACMGLSKRAISINEDNIDYYLSNIENVKIDREKVLDMVEHFREARYDGDYLE